MSQPKDFNKTDPLYQQLMGDDEAIHPNRSGKDKGKRHQKQEWLDGQDDSVNCGPEGPARDFAPEFSETSSSHESSMSFFSFLIPPLHDRPENIRRHRIAITLSVMTLFLGLAAAYGFFEKFGISGFARADSITKATKPLETQITEQTQLLDKVSRQLIEQLAAGTASEIRAKTAKRCLETNPSERDRLIREIDKLQDQYKEYKGGARYDAPSCAEL